MLHGFNHGYFLVFKWAFYQEFCMNNMTSQKKTHTPWMRILNVQTNRKHHFQKG